MQEKALGKRVSRGIRASQALLCLVSRACDGGVVWVGAEM